MRAICISPRAQRLGLLGLLGGLVALVASQEHEIRRYIKIETM